MRVFLLVLAIVLLPLRGWMSGAMAMTPPPAVASASQAVAAADAMPPCHGASEAAEAVKSSDHEAPANSAHHAQCSLCQLCHSAVMAETVAALPAAAPQQARPQTPVPRFASAQPQQADKPPIS